MYLSTKYLYGAGFLIGSWLLIYTLSADLYYAYGYLNSKLLFTEEPLPFILIGFFISVVSIYFYILLFSKERIRGMNLEFEASPDLKTFRIVKDHKSNRQMKGEIPSTAYCSACGREVHKPFRCAACGQLLCATHILAGDHICKEEI